MWIDANIINDPDYLGEKFSKPMAWIDMQLLSKDGIVKASYGELAARWKWSKNKVIRFINELESNRSVERSVCNFEGCKTEQSIRIISTIYDASRNDNESFRGTFQEETPLSSPLCPSSSLPPTPPIISTPVLSPSISPQEEEIQPTASAYAYLPTSEKALSQALPQKEDWRHLSSVRKFSLGNIPDNIADYKRQLITQELSVIASEIGMPKEAQDKFIAKWCEHNPGNERIKADYEPTFNVRDRAIQWMGWWEQKAQPASLKEKQRNEKLNPNSKWGR